MFVLDDIFGLYRPVRHTFDLQNETKIRIELPYNGIYASMSPKQICVYFVSLFAFFVQMMQTTNPAIVTIPNDSNISYSISNLSTFVNSQIETEIPDKNFNTQTLSHCTFCA